MAGGIASATPGYGQHPNAALLYSEPFPFEEKHREERTAATGLPAERFHLVDGRVLSWHGASTPEGIDDAARLLITIRAA